MDIEDQIKNLTEEGTKALNLGEFEKAIEKFSEVSELSTIIYGNVSEEYAKALYNYGRALLENAMVQNKVLANDALEQQSKNDTITDDLLQQQPNTSHLYFEGEPDFSDGNDEVDVVNLVEEIDSITETIAETTISNDDQSDDDLTLAWQILELARITYLKIDSKDKEKKLILGEIYIKLGDVSLESENLDQAAIDYQEGVKIKSEFLPEDNQLLPDRSRLESAIDYVQKAIIVLQNRKKNLKSQLIALQEKVGKGKQVATTDDEDSSIIEDEIKEIDELLVEMETKLEDLKTVKSSNDELKLNPIDMTMDEYKKSTTTTTAINDDSKNNEFNQEKKRTLESDNDNNNSEDVKKSKTSNVE
ncbi:4640_t:CDS:2 [Entrophospora sp. SA101]|nr:4640_t:CDS:2 [Entrophospora sp. SA101]